MKQIKDTNVFVICRFDGVDADHVYTGGFGDLQKAELKWNKEYIELMEMEVETLTLDEIREQLGHTMITIFRDSPMSGTILQYGNYGDSWWEIGTTCGYA